MSVAKRIHGNHNDTHFLQKPSLGWSVEEKRPPPVDDGLRHKKGTATRDLQQPGKKHRAALVAEQRRDTRAQRDHTKASLILCVKTKPHPYRSYEHEQYDQEVSAPRGGGTTEDDAFLAELYGAVDSVPILPGVHTMTALCIMTDTKTGYLDNKER